MLKYNATHPRTDVHIDNGVLALTLALSPIGDYAGGGTFFEHLGEEELVEMDAGFATWRPGSVRHGGHRVTSGERYIIGAFLLLEDRVEHVRRLKNRGSKLQHTSGVWRERERERVWRPKRHGVLGVMGRERERERERVAVTRVSESHFCAVTTKRGDTAVETSSRETFFELLRLFF